MESRNLLPQNTRLMANLLSFSGGALDVFCHMYYHSLVATQTGNILWLVADWRNSSMYNNLLRCFSILFFSLGFLFGMWFKDKRKNAYWRVYGLLPLCVMTAILPFLPSNALIELPIIAFSAGIMMKTFTGSQIENHPFVIFMTSGNYRRMLTALYYAIQGSGDQKEYRRQAVNYSFVVGSFVVGAIVAAVLMHHIHIWSIWIITLSLITIMVYYSSEVKRLEDVQKSEQLVIEALAFIRGRSLSETYCIIDEAQNLTPHEIKTIITRAGEGTKMVFTGDIQQIDQPYLDSQSNGLVYMIDRMRDQNLFAHVNLVKGERSQLSELASNLM